MAKETKARKLNENEEAQVSGGEVREVRQRAPEQSYCRSEANCRGAAPNVRVRDFDNGGFETDTDKKGFEKIWWNFSRFISDIFH